MAAKAKPRKWAELKKTLPALPPDLKYDDGMKAFEKINQLKAELMHLNQGELAEAYKACNALEEELKAELSELNIKFEALSELLVKQMESQGVASFKIPTGGTAYMEDKPRVTVKDKTACREWFKAKGMEEILNPHPSSLQAMVNGILENPLEVDPDNPDQMRPKELPAGIDIYMDTYAVVKKK